MTTCLKVLQVIPANASSRLGLIFGLGLWFGIVPPVLAETVPEVETELVPNEIADQSPPASETSQPTPDIDLDPQIIEESPVLQRWLEAVPDVAHDIKHTPAFRTRARLGYSEFPSADGTGGIIVGIQDVFVGQTPLTLSADYAGNGRGDRNSAGVEARYYLLPLGSYVNVAPIVGYRYLELDDFISDGLAVGLQVIVVPSRSGAADLSLAQTWVAPGTDNEVGQTTLSFGYAVTHQLRLATDIQLLNSPDGPDSRVSLLVEWLL